MTAGTNQAETTSAMRWIGARLRCASATMATIRASMVSEPILSARMINAPVPFTVPPMTLSPVCFSTGIDSPVTIDFIDGAAAFQHRAVNRHAVARSHPQPVTDVHCGDSEFPHRRLHPSAGGRSSAPG